MQPKTFTYLTHKFKPLGILPKNFDFFEVIRQCRSIGIANYQGGDYSHEEFYNEAGKIGAKETDIFLGSMVVKKTIKDTFSITQAAVDKDFHFDD